MYEMEHTDFEAEAMIDEADRRRDEQRERDAIERATVSAIEQAARS